MLCAKRFRARTSYLFRYIWRTKNKTWRIIYWLMILLTGERELSQSSTTSTKNANNRVYERSKKSVWFIIIIKYSGMHVYMPCFLLTAVRYLILHSTSGLCFDCWWAAAALSICRRHFWWWANLTKITLLFEQAWLYIIQYK